MAPQEKATQLINKYYCKIIDTVKFKKSVSLTEAKFFALIAIDEIIEQWDYIDTYLADGRGELNPNLKYWYDVKKCVEIS